MNPIEIIQSHLTQVFGRAAQTAFLDANLTGVIQAASFQPPPKAGMGDYALGCFELAKRLKLPPPQVAQRLHAALQIDGDAYIAKVETAGPYLNLHLQRPAVTKAVLQVIAQTQGAYGNGNEGSGKTIVIDYSSPNIAKPLAFHHLRSAVIGQSLKNIFRALGYQVIGINHLGDWGTQFGKLLRAYEAWGPKDGDLGTDPVTTLNGLYVRFQQESKTNPALNDEGRAWFKRLEDGDALAKARWQQFRDASLQVFDRVYKRLHISFEEVTGESFFIDHVNALLQRLDEKKLSSMSEGALIVDLSAYQMPPCLLKKGDETTLYATRDLCAAIHRFDTYHFERLLYVVDTGQSLHFKQLFKVLELMGFAWAKQLEHVNFGIIKFGGTKTRTREGNVILLEEVIDEAVLLIREKIRDKNPNLANAEEVAEVVGLGAIVFADLSGRRQRDVNFVWEEILNFDGRTGPYLQYSHARAHSILRNASDEDRRAIPSAHADLLTLEEEWEVVWHLARFPLALRRAAAESEPSYVADALLDLCEAFHRYHATGKTNRAARVLCEQTDLRQARLRLTQSVTDVLHKGLLLLGMAAPQAM